MDKRRKEIIAGNEISVMKTYSLGGYTQKVLIEGKKKDLPVVVFLHGGPGSPIPFCAGCRGLFPEITDKLIMVYWDQLGCGINDYTIDNSFSIDTYVGMTVDLIRELKKEFKENKIHLFGMSWGSIIALKTAHIIPDEINSVVTYGQVLKELGFNQEVFSALANSKMSESKKKALSEISSKKELTLTEWKTLMKSLQKYTEANHCKSGGKAPIGNIIKGIMFSSDYTLKDFKALVVNGTTKNTSLFEELVRLDLSHILEAVSVPYLILQGSTDIVTSTSFIEAFMNNTNNKNLKFEIIEKSGHMPGAYGMEKVLEKMFSFFGAK